MCIVHGCFTLSLPSPSPSMEHWQEIPLKTPDVELIIVDNVALHHG